MLTPRVVHVVALMWFFGWGVFLLRFPAQCYRLLAWGRQPTAKQIKTARIVGYLGLVFGGVLFIELAFGVLP